MMKIKIAVVAAVTVVTALGWAPSANAVEPGCESVPWGFLGSQTRSICDGPMMADGSWTRFRMVWVPAHQVPLRTSCYGTYSVSCSTTGGYWADDVIISKEKYPVTPDIVVPGEPGWLPPTVTDSGGFTPINYS